MSESQLLKPSEIKANVPKLKGHTNFQQWDMKLRSQLRICGISNYLNATSRPAEPHRLTPTQLESLPLAIHTACKRDEDEIDAESPPTVLKHGGQNNSEVTGTRSLLDREMKEWQYWATRESRTRAAIEDTLDDNIAALYNHHRSAHEMYHAICAVYKPAEDADMADQYIRQLNALKLKKGATPSQLQMHLTAFNELNSKIITYGTRLADTELIRLFKGSLTATELLHVNVAVNALASDKRDFTAWQREFANHIRHLQADEPSRHSSSSVTATPSTNATVDPSAKKGDSKKGRRGRPRASDFPPLTAETIAKAKANDNWCEVHKLPGHPTHKCRRVMEAIETATKADKQKDGQKTGDKDKSSNNGKPVASSISAIDLNPFQDKHSLRFLIDGGATIHMVSSPKYLSSVHKLDEPLRIGLAWTNNYIFATHVGDLVIAHDNGKLIFPNVYVSAETEGRILSEEALVADGWTINKSSLSMRKGATTLSLDKLHAHPRLTFLTFELDTEDTEDPPQEQEEPADVISSVEVKEEEHNKQHDTCPQNLTLSDSADTAPIVLARPDSKLLADLHVRLGHLSRTKLLELIHKGAIHNVTPADVVDDNWSTIDCAPCAQQKTTKLPRPGPSPRGNARHEMVHCDIKGPITPVSILGERYICTMLADFTGYRMLKPIKTKDQSAYWLRHFINMVERAAGVTIVIVRTDGGMEFKSLEMNDFYSRKGIQHHISPPYDPALNGPAERLNRTGGEAIATLMTASQLPPELWCFAAMYVSDLLNATTFMADGVTPFEKIRGRKPDLANLRPFGEYVHARITLRQHGDGIPTFSRERSVTGRALARDHNYSAWWIYTNTGQLAVCRDIYQYDRQTRHRTGVFPIDLDAADDNPLVDIDLTGILPDPPPDANELEEETVEVVNRHQEVDENLRAQQGEQANIPVDSPDDHAEPDLPRLQNLTLSDSVVPDRLPVANNISAFIALDTFTDEEGEYAIVYLDELGVSSITELISSATTTVAPPAVDTDDDLEPVNVQEALDSPDAEHWLEAMRCEIKQFNEKNTWVETTLPNGRRAVTAKWVFRRKRDENGNIVKYKARLVARGFTQIHGVDYDETYAPVARMSRLRLLFTIAATNDMELGQADVEGAYLNGKVDEELYLAPPDGVKLSNPDADVFQIKGAIYGLKQSGRLWWIEANKRLSAIGFTRCPDEWGLFARRNPDNTYAYLSLYVDDTVTATTTVTERLKIYADLRTHWRITDMGEPQYILGVRIDRDRILRTITLSQPTYIASVAERFGITQPGTTGRKAPLPVGTQTYKDILTAEDDSLALPSTRHRRYQEMVGTIQWVAGATRPDVAFAASFLGRVTHAPTERAEALAERTIAYLVNTNTDGITLGGTQSAPLQVYSDADHAGDLQTRRSTTGVIAYFNHSPITWSSRRQATVSQSSAEAEFIAASEGGREAIWLRRVLNFLGFPQGSPTNLYVDNEAAIKLGDRPTTFPLNKHIDIRRHMLRDYVADRTLKLRPVKSAKQRADILTKPLAGPAHQLARKQLRIASIPY